MLLPILGNKQHKVNKHNFAKGPTYSFQTFYKNKTAFISFLFSFVAIFFFFFHKSFYAT